MAVLSRDVHLVLIPGADRLRALQTAELPQRDGLCGPFWVTVAVRALAGRDDVTQEDAALAAGTLVAGPPVLPPGETSSPPRRPLPAGQPAQAGTSASGLVASLAALAPDLAAVPVPGHALTPGRLTTLLHRLADAGEPLACLANLATGRLADSHGGPGGAEWSVGHVVALLGIEGDRVAVADSYGSLGVGGVHEQPASRVAAGLRREGEDAEGGLLLVVGSSAVPEVQDALRRAGLGRGLWDNGTPSG